MANNPNFDGMAEPASTYVDIDYGNPYRLLTLPTLGSKRKKRTAQAQVPTEAPSDTMQNIQLQLNMVPGYKLPEFDVKAEETPVEKAEAPAGDFVERPAQSQFITPPVFRRRFELPFSNKPMANELAAARRGRRWYYNLERSFMPPGSEWNNTVFNGVAAEKPYPTDIEGNKTGTGGSGVMSPLAYVRERGQWLSERNKMIQDYINGNWDDPERAYEDFKRELADFDKRMEAAGFSTTGLRVAPPLSGKRGGFTEKAGPSKMRRQWNYANSVVKEIQGWIDSGKINDKKFMGSNLTAKYLDDTYETLTKYFKESGNAMADEEKKRLQIQVLPEESYEKVLQTVKAYQKALAQVMRSASAKDWSQNNRGKVNEVIKALGFDPDNMDKAALGEQMAALGGIIFSALARNDELPHDVATDLKALNDQYDTYMANMMLAANVGVEFVTTAASRLGNMVGDAYNDQAFTSGRDKADYLGEVEDITAKIPKGANVVSRLLDPPQFIAPSLAKKPKGRISTNPESTGENEPAGYDSVPGVSFED
jgi:hypothetical protein